MRKLTNVLKSPRLLTAAIVLFALQGIFFSFAIPYKSPSDEEFHFRLTQYYAQRSVLAGPVITEQTDNFDLGDIQRPPGYLYHYLSSFLLKVIQPFIRGVDGQVIALRLVNVGLGVLTIILAVRLLRRLGARGVTINLVVAWLAITTMFVWLFAALNYDNLAIVLFFVMLHTLLSLYQKVHITPLLLSLIISFALMLTKETFLPVIFICYVLVLIGLIRKSSLNSLWKSLCKSVTASWKDASQKKILLLLTVFVVLAAGMFFERYGQNYLRYQKTTPACSQVHSEDECMQNSIYRRNKGQRQEYVVYRQNGGKPSMNIGQFTVKWWRLIYERTYFFRGMATTNPTWQARIVAEVTAPVLLVIAGIGMRKRRYSPPEKALAIVTVSYVILVFLYNLNTYLYYGYPFAIQGRYLLPVLPLFYYFVVSAMLTTYQKSSLSYRRAILSVLTVLVIANLLFHLPLMIYRQKGDLLRRPEAGITQSSIG